MLVGTIFIKSTDVMEQKIKVNRAKCKICGDIKESSSKNDTQLCSCGNLAVSGGKEKLKRHADVIEEVKEMSEYEQCKKCGAYIVYHNGFNEKRDEWEPQNSYWYCEKCNEKY